MTITAADIKLVASERMADTTDGGGRRTSNVIADGVAGNIYPKVSRMDSVYGRVNLRKVFAHVDTANVDTYAGAHAAIIDAPDNDKIVVNIFSTGSDFDERTAARDHIESYLVSGPASKMVMYGRQLAGQGAFVVYQRVEETLPEIGDVYCLSNEAAGVVSYQQFVRVQDVSHEVRTFTDDQGDFQRNVITLKIGSPLRYEFDGIEVPSRLTVNNKAALVRSTTVADASRYYGIQPVTGGVLQGALDISVKSIYASIAPTAQHEVPISNGSVGGAAQLVAAGTDFVGHHQVGDLFPGSTSGSNAAVRKTVTLNVQGGIVPGSLRMRMQTVSKNYWVSSAQRELSDDGKGNIAANTGDIFWNLYSATVDYENGIVVADIWYDGIPTFAGTFTNTQDNVDAHVSLNYIPAVAVSQTAHTLELPVTINSRGTVQVVTLSPLPAKGATIVDFRALGKWYRLRDDGTGALVGDDPAYGTGTVDPVTGNVVVTLGALPDVGSSVIFSWASPVHYTALAGANTDADTQAVQIISVPVAVGSRMVSNAMSVQYTSGGVQYTASGDSLGHLSGGGITGTIDSFKGTVTIGYGTRLPDPDSQIVVGYTKEDPADPQAPLTQSGSVNVVGAGKTLNVPTPIGTLQITVPVHTPAFAQFAPLAIPIVAAPDSNGKLITLAGTKTYAQNSGPPSYWGPNWTVPGGDEIGTVDLASGVVTLYDGAVVTVSRAYYAYYSGGWSPAQDYSVAIDDGAVYFAVGLSNTAGGTSSVTGINVSLTDAPLTLDLTKHSTAHIVPGSVRFNAYGKSYFDRNGVIYHTIQPDGTGTAAGSIDYATGIVTLTAYGTESASVSVIACLTKFGEFTGTKATFRTAGSPLRPASTFVQVIAMDGATLSATADNSGNLTGDYVRGTVNEQMGVVHIEWGEMVASAGNETQPWYDAAQVVNGQIWKPREVLPNTLTYNTVVQTSLPLNADIIGLDPVRLPSDGRVPIFRAGDVVLIHNTKTTALPALAAGATYDLGRTDLAFVSLVDSTGAAVPATSYIVDYAAGTITMAADFAVGTLVAPFTAKHRIEELNLASDVQINGQIELSSALSRDFDADTLVSGALLFGDLFARVSNVFDQVTWTNEWSDSLIGTNGTAEYNTVGFPIVVENDGAVTERWRMNFTSGTAFQVVGENLGVIATGSTTADCAPVNPLTNKPYFTIKAGGWGAGWVAGQQLRFNTIGASAPVWMVRTVLPGASLTGDSIDIQIRGDVDA